MGERDLLFHETNIDPSTGNFLDNSKNKEKEKTEIIIYEYKDANGNKLCDVEVELGANVKFKGENGRELKDYKLIYQKDGRMEKFSMMDLLTNKLVKIIVQTERTHPTVCPKYQFDYEANQIFSPPLKHQIDLGVFLHEVGHANQFGTEFYRRIADKGRFLRVSNDDQESIGLIKELAKGTRYEKDAENIENIVMDIERMDREIEELSEEIKNKEDDAVYLRLQSDERSYRGVLEILESEKIKDQKRIDEMRGELAQLELKVSTIKSNIDLLQSEYKKKINIRDPLHQKINNLEGVVNMILEQDATRREMRALKKIPVETGINAKTKVKIPLRDISSQIVPEITKMTDEQLGNSFLEISILQFGVMALHTYQAARGDWGSYKIITG